MPNCFEVNTTVRDKQTDTFIFYLSENLELFICVILYSGDFYYVGISFVNVGISGHAFLDNTS